MKDNAAEACLEHRMKWYSAPESGIFCEGLETVHHEIGISSCEDMPCWQDCPFNPMKNKEISK
jgi:hypothetical protein